MVRVAGVVVDGDICRGDGWVWMVNPIQYGALCVSFALLTLLESKEEEKRIVLRCVAPAKQKRVCLSLFLLF